MNEKPTRDVLFGLDGLACRHAPKTSRLAWGRIGLRPQLRDALRGSDEDQQ
jgi:hypothetical protein